MDSLFLPVATLHTLRGPRRDDPKKVGFLYRGLPNATPECPTCTKAARTWIGGMEELSNGAVALACVTCACCGSEWVRTRDVGTDAVTFTKVKEAGAM